MRFGTDDAHCVSPNSPTTRPRLDKELTFTSKVTQVEAILKASRAPAPSKAVEKTSREESQSLACRSMWWPGCDLGLAGWALLSRLFNLPPFSPHSSPVWVPHMWAEESQ